MDLMKVPTEVNFKQRVTLSRWRLEARDSRQPGKLWK